MELYGCYFQYIFYICAMKKKVKSPTNEFRKVFSDYEVAPIFNTMKLIGCTSKSTALSMAFRLFIEKFGKPLEHK